MLTVNTVVNFKSFTEMLNVLPTDKACREYLELTLWNGKPTCPHCGSMHSYILKNKGQAEGLYKCKDCQKRYTVTVGTMFHGSHIPLRKWFIAIYIFSMHKKGISSHQLASDLGITQKSAWYMLGRIRYAFKGNTLEMKKGAIIEMDSTFVGGKLKNKHAFERKQITEKFGPGVGNKTSVFGMLERDGNVNAVVVNSETAEDIIPIVNELVYPDNTVVTDSHGAYATLDKFCKHEVVNHNKGEYVVGKFHTNSIEGFWSQMKRGIYGVYHHVSPKHLHRYCAEFSYRYNVRKQTVDQKFNFSLLHSERLRYSDLIR